MRKKTQRAHRKEEFLYRTEHAETRLSIRHERIAAALEKLAEEEAELLDALRALAAVKKWLKGRHA